jgi:hypothetical protein
MTSICSTQSMVQIPSGRCVMARRHGDGRPGDSMAKSGLSDSEITKRLPLWVALADLFLDGGLENLAEIIVRAAREGGSPRKPFATFCMRKWGRSSIPTCWLWRDIGGTGETTSFAKRFANISAANRCLGGNAASLVEQSVWRSLRSGLASRRRCSTSSMRNIHRSSRASHFRQLPSGCKTEEAGRRAVHRSCALPTWRGVPMPER